MIIEELVLAIFTLPVVVNGEDWSKLTNEDYISYHHDMESLLIFVSYKFN